MEPIIGIIMRDSLSSTNQPVSVVYKDLINAIIKSGGKPIGISNNFFDKYINLCQGFIIQGGDDIDEHDLKIIKELKEKNIPLLGICLGMQEMAYLNNGEIFDINNHKISSMHEVNINKDSLLYKIMGCEKTMVNSRHKSAVKKTNLFISSRSNDKIIESVEDKTKKFFIGLQWHPENLYNSDLNSKKIFDYFIKACNN